LVVKVRTALGMAPAVAPRPFAAGAGGKLSPAAAGLDFKRAPVTSTEWLERRGLFETLSASEAAAVQTAGASAAPAAIASAPSRPFPAPLPVRPESAPASAVWVLAFLPVAAVLLKKLS
jgi:hypothetical protein